MRSKGPDHPTNLCSLIWTFNFHLSNLPHQKNLQIKSKDPDHPKSILFDLDFHYSPADSTTTEGSLDKEKNPDQLGDSADEEQRS